MSATPHPSEQDLLLHHYEPDERVAGHLAICASCRASSAELATLLESVGELPVPERDGWYGARVWRRLEPSLPPAGSRRLFGQSGAPRAQRPPTPPGQRPGLFPWPRLAFAGALFALVLGAFLLGRSFPAREPIPQAARERLLLLAIGEHLDRSQMVLLELDRPGDETSFALERTRADRLVAASRVYRSAAEGAGEARLAHALEELERLLLDIARAPDEDREALAARVAGHGTLLRVRVLGTQVRERERALRPNSSKPRRAGLV